MGKQLAFIFLVFFCFIGFNRSAKAINSSLNKPFIWSKNDSTPKIHSPKRATIYSAILPGLGQAYNKKYWKIGVIYAGLGTSTFFMLYNRTELRGHRADIRALSDNSPLTIPSYQPNTNLELSKQNRDIVKKYRDYSIIAMTVLYVLNIVDATVDAHLYEFNINKELSGVFQPVASPTVLGASLSIRF